MSLIFVFVVVHIGLKGCVDGVFSHVMCPIAPFTLILGCSWYDPIAIALFLSTVMLLAGHPEKRQIQKSVYNISICNLFQTVQYI